VVKDRTTQVCALFGTCGVNTMYAPDVPVVRVETAIAAPPQVCFDLARDAGLHARSAAATGERVLRATRDLLELGDEVTFEARHLGVWWRLTARITRFEPPRLFVDEQVRGPFRWLAHAHEFIPTEGGRATLMVDRFAFVSPLGVLGRLADRLVLARHLRRFLEQRARFLKRAAEAGSAAERGGADFG
jgi:ligand-binding SRPBCC domain-containing protein